MSILYCPIDIGKGEEGQSSGTKVSLPGVHGGVPGRSLAKRGQEVHRGSAAFFWELVRALPGLAEKSNHARRETFCTCGCMRSIVYKQPRVRTKPSPCLGIEDACPGDRNGGWIAGGDGRAARG